MHMHCTVHIDSAASIVVAIGNIMTAKFLLHKVLGYQNSAGSSEMVHLENVCFFIYSL